MFSDANEGNGNQVIPETKHNERIVPLQGEIRGTIIVQSDAWENAS
jgi:hypothetical protein